MTIVESFILSRNNEELSNDKDEIVLFFKQIYMKILLTCMKYKQDMDLREEYDLKKMLTGARDKNRSEDINIDYPGMQGYKDKLKEISFKFNNLQEQIKILLSKIKISNSIKPAFVQICQLLGYKSEVIEIMANSEKERKRILEIKL